MVYCLSHVNELAIYDIIKMAQDEASSSEKLGYNSQNLGNG